MESPLFPPKFERSLIEHMHGGILRFAHFEGGSEETVQSRV